jgi:hypothetical protein
MHCWSIVYGTVHRVSMKLKQINVKVFLSLVQGISICLAEVSNSA